ncbi:hypothetical protein RFI_16650 [Reticulomyxa filosa]|uniref:Uncharacterized protein n=1 Tax=Reticulomyxa filosa TaxID=46433 RepID=X6N3S0_RETFI|nr:hypothetical protein RFI_16650 [Reticulomyxa filosa]|eukprot:ETO20563.1 hypothetical protein RFI_16650 [Reticulomyxa filosa]
MSTRKIQYGSSDPLPDESIFNTFLSFRKLKDATKDLRNGEEELQGKDELTKLTAHLETLAKKEAKWLVGAFDLIYSRPELAIMLGGSGLEQVRVLAKMLKQEADRVYIRDLLELPSQGILRELGPLGLGPSVKIQSTGPLQVYKPRVKDIKPTMSKSRLFESESAAEYIALSGGWGKTNAGNINAIGNYDEITFQ